MQNIVESMVIDGAATGAFIAGGSSSSLNTSPFQGPPPYPVMFGIFQCLDWYSLLQCRLVCSEFQQRIDASWTHQYKIELAVAGQQYGSCGNLFTRRDRLKFHQNRWDTLQWTRCFPLPMINNRWVFCGGVFARVGVVPCTLRLTRIPSPLRGIEPASWFLDLSGLLRVDGRIEEFGMDPSQDLLYVVKYYGDHDLKIHLLTLSSGEPHPLASGPFKVPPDPETEGGPQWCNVDIFHEFLAVHSMENIMVWNWKTGEELMPYLKYCVMSMVFLNERYIMLGVHEDDNVDENEYEPETFLLVFDFLAKIEGRQTRENQVDDFFIKFPEISDQSSVHGISIHTNRRTAWGADTDSSVPFSMTPQDRLFIINISFDNYTMCFAVLEESFLNLINGPNGVLTEEAIIFDWPKWGPEHSRVFTVPSSHHAKSSHGTRLAMTRHIPYQGTFLDVLDFNQLKCRKRYQDYGNVGIPGNTINASQSGWTVPHQPVCVLGPTTIGRTELYDEINTHLGFSVTSRPVDPGLQVAACGEDAIIMEDMNNRIFHIYTV